MKIKKILMNNFRQFADEVELEFSTDSSANVTVIHGENGAGKTSLLNAFKWAFYGDTDFDTGEKNLLNERAIANSSLGSVITMKVSVWFEHDDKQYKAEREQRYTKRDSAMADKNGKELFLLSWSEGGQPRVEKDSSALSRFGSLLPNKLHSYFFFNGERIDKLANRSSEGEIREAIKTLMGLEIVERGVEHLEKLAIKKLKQEKANLSSADVQHIMRLENDVEDEIDRLQEQIKLAQKNQKGIEAEQQFVSNNLRKSEASGRLQKERDRLVNALNNDSAAYEEVVNKRRQLITQFGFLAFTQKLEEDAALKLENCRVKGMLPFKVREQFIDDLLLQKQCICGVALIKPSAEYTNVDRYREKAGSSDVEEAYNATSAGLRQMSGRRTELFERLSEFASKLNNLENEMEKNKKRQDEISLELKGSKDVDISAMEEKFRKLGEQRDECIRAGAEANSKLVDQKQIQKDYAKQRKDLESKSKQSGRVEQQLDLAMDCLNVLKELEISLQNTVRVDLSKRVNETFQSVLRKGYWAEISSDYTLEIYKSIDGQKRLVSEKSTGENQITSLSFIASIVALAKEKSGNDSMFWKGGLYPIVMDSPFGALDDEYRAKVAEFIPKLAEQVIIMASSSQWQGSVEKACGHRVGRELRLIYHAPEINPENETVFLKHSADFEFTTVEESFNG